VKIVHGNLLEAEADVIVNPANSFLRHGGGLAKIIADAATAISAPPAEGGIYHTAYRTERYFAESEAADHWRREQADHPNIPTGGVGVTSAGALPFKSINHAVGPIWGGGSYCEDTLLARAHIDAFEMCCERGWKSVAVPAISCGIFGFPVERAARVAVLCADAYDDVLDITFCLFSQEHYDAYMAAAKEKGLSVA
jgi:putative ATPase